MKPIKIVLLSVLGLIVLITFLSTFQIVGAGERGVLLTFGAFNGTVFQPGIHLKLPFVQEVIVMDVRTQKLDIDNSEAYSHDLQVVETYSVVNYNLDPQAVGTIYQQYGLDYEAKMLHPNLEASVKQTIAKYSAETILSDRATIQTEIQEVFKQSVPNAFTITKYALVNESFSKTYEAAIEAKQVAQQDAEKAQNELKKAQIDAQSRIAQAKGEAEAIQIQAAAIQQQGGANYVQLQAIQKWDGKLPIQMIPGSTVPFINLTK